MVLNLPCRNSSCSFFVFCTLSGVSAWLAWGQGLTWVALFALPCWAAAAHSRRRLAAVAWVYYAVAMIELIALPQIFFQTGPITGLVLGLASWLSWSAVLAAACAIGWHSSLVVRILSVPLAALLINLPPIGWFSIVSPWTATGLWFPGHGWIGIALALLTCAAMACVLIWPHRLKSWSWLVIAGSYLAPVHARDFDFANSEITVHAVQTRWGEVRLDPVSQHRRVADFTQMEKAIPKEARLVIWPEMAIGQWSARTQYWLSDQSSQGPAEGQTWLVGAAIERTGPPHADWTNGFLLWESNKSPVFIDGRIPMPIGMWRPGAFSFNPWANSVVTIDRHKVGVSICYEDLLPWTAWQLHFQSVDRVVSISSMWFAQDMNLNRNLAHSAQAWARLFGVPYARAVNF